VKIVIKVNAVNARNGIVTKPNQLIYSALHGTPLAQGLISPMPGLSAPSSERMK
jgi:hypothetical protein